MIRELLPVIVFVLYSGNGFALKADPNKILALGIDYNDQVYKGFDAGYLYGEESIRGLIREVKTAGFDEIYWRVSFLGQVTYPSKVTDVPDGTRAMAPYLGVYGLLLKQCDPLAVAVDECRKNGMKIFVYLTLFDFAYPGAENSFFEEHPEYYARLAGVVADHVSSPLEGAETVKEFSDKLNTGYPKSFKENMRRAKQGLGGYPYVPGIPSYGYKEVRDYVMSIVKEVIGYNPDGIYFCVSRTHAGSYPVLSTGWYPQWTQPYLKFGYNEPEVAYYHKLYGKLPPTRSVTDYSELRETPEEQAWSEVRGHFLTEFIREASKEIHKAGMELAVGFYPKSNNGYYPGYQTRQHFGILAIQWRKWADESLVDVIRVQTDHRKHGYDDWIEHSADIYNYAQNNGVRVYIDLAIENQFDKLQNPPASLPIHKDQHPKLYFDLIADLTAKIIDSTADGVFYYEAAHNDQRTWNAIKRGSRR